ncbi:sporulation membrane protein YtaF [Peribacillus kribbensis]|uniref:sporulation membrane protein YtaF n=1 Tax=Peribacillus kribbensis TaxID=356658 RepID=UPI000425AD29|nr:sporulation membrane protein YtaF [Peribacillus kribbensis]
MFVELLFIIILGISLSFDSLAVGFSYGLKGISIPLPSLYLIGSITAAAFFLSMLIGQTLSHYISSETTTISGGIILIFLGSAALLKFLKQQGSETILKNNQLKSRAFTENQRKILKFFNIKIVIEILRKPEKADIDNSGTISLSESIMLGFALSLDAMGVGVGAAFQGYPLFLTPLIVALISGCVLLMGAKLGRTFQNIKWMKKLEFLPGCVLIVLGVSKLIF